MSYDIGTWDRNCNVEHTEPLQGTLTGSIPSWLSGSLVCNGPGLMKYGSQEFKHVFDGSAILQKFSISETGISYTSKFIKSHAYQANTEHQQIVVSEFGTTGSSTSKNFLSKLGSKFQFDKMFSDNTPVCLSYIAGSYYATTEAPFLHRIDLDSLDTCDKVDLHKLLGLNSQCPHPHALLDGSAVNVHNTVGSKGPRYEVVKFPATGSDVEGIFGKPTRLAMCDTRWKLHPCHMHTFGLTDNYALLPEQPLTVDVTAMVANTIRDKPLIEGMEWLKDKQVKYRVLSLETGKELKLKVKSESFFYMHMVNCFEEADHLVFDINTFNTPSLLHEFKLENLRKKGDTLAQNLDSGCVRRFVLPLDATEKVAPEENLVKLPGVTATAHRQKDGTIFLTSQKLSDVAYENQTMNRAFERKPYSFFYGISLDMTSNKTTIGKVNVKTGEVKTWDVQDDVYAASVAFVSRPGATTEDDGVVLVHCLHKEPRRVLLTILSATDLTELATTTFLLNCDAPRPLHAIYKP
ncbi:Carotenoid oxygenase [Trinorchestia longiramus]|nr:Carotenoid oxygenase [Trinorchestia longiramus]